MSWFWSLILAVVAVVVWFGLRRLYQSWREYEEYLKRGQEIERRVRTLTLEQAREEAYQLLQDTSFFRLVPRTKPLDEAVLSQLPDDVAELAEQYERIELVQTGSESFPPDYLSFEQIVPSELRPGLLRIGETSIGIDTYEEVAIEPGKRGVRCIPLEGPEPDGYASIFHWIIEEYHISKHVDDYYQH